MKVKFSSETKFLPEWNGNLKAPAAEQISCIIKPLVLGDMMILMDAMGSVSSSDGKPMQITGEQAMRLVSAAKDILPKYVQLNNLEDDDGPVGLDKITTYAQYLPLAAEIIMACINSSTPNQETEGNSSAPPG